MSNPVFQKIEFARAVEKELRANVLQAKEIGPGKYSKMLKMNLLIA